MAILYPKQPKYVYLIRAYDNNEIFYKIGFTGNVRKRMCHLILQYDFQMELVHVIASYSAPKLEKELHRKYDGSQVFGEWYYLNDSDVEYIKSL